MQLSENDQNLENSQKIYFDNSGMIVHSCDSIFSIEHIVKKNVKEFFPLIESIFEHILSLKLGDTQIQIQRIDTNFPPLKGLYDFIFQKAILKEQELNLLIINDHTKLYQRQRDEMQIKNEIAIKKSK